MPRSSAASYLRPQRGPYEACIAVVLLILGVFSIVGATREEPAGALNTFDLFERYAYGGLATTGASMTLIGLFMSSSVPSLLVERAGQYTLGFGAAVFVAVQMATGSPPIYSVCINMAIGFAAFWRTIQITRAVRQWPHQITNAIAAIEEIGGSPSEGDDT